MSILYKLVTMDLETLMNEMKHSIKSMKKSRFYREFLRQMNGSEIMGEMRRVQQTDTNHMPFQMVLYGLGSIENSEASRLQLDQRNRNLRSCSQSHRSGSDQLFGVYVSVPQRKCKTHSRGTNAILHATLPNASL